MHTSFTIGLTTSQYKGLQYVAVDPKEWIAGLIENRAHVAIQDIVKLNADHCNANGIAIGVGVTAQVEQAYTLNVIKTAADRRSGISSE
tara:strand:- start:2032 stop:2298 length:267 start_codon:yes stop_codon:yes gene_type:complete